MTRRFRGTWEVPPIDGCHAPSGGEAADGGLATTRATRLPARDHQAPSEPEHQSGQTANAAVVQIERLGQQEAITRFLTSPGHHLVAYERDHLVGFVTGVEMTHPDKGNRDVPVRAGSSGSISGAWRGRRPCRASGGSCSRRGVQGMWVVTDEENAAAGAGYRGVGGTPEPGQTLVLLEVLTGSQSADRCRSGSPWPDGRAPEIAPRRDIRTGLASGLP